MKHIRETSNSREAMDPVFHALFGAGVLLASGIAYNCLSMSTPDQKAGVALAGAAGLASLGYSVYENICLKSER